MLFTCDPPSNDVEVNTTLPRQLGLRYTTSDRFEFLLRANAAPSNLLLAYDEDSSILR